MTVLAVLLTWVALDVAILWALTRWKHVEPQTPTPDVPIARIQRNGLVRLHPKEKP